MAWASPCHVRSMLLWQPGRVAAMSQVTALSPELLVRLGVDEPLEAASAAVRSCAAGNGLESGRATRLQVMVEELLREALDRELSGGEDGIELRVECDGSSIAVVVVDHRLPVSQAEARSLPSRRLLRLGFVDRLSISFEGTAGNVARCEIELHPVAGPVGDELPELAEQLVDEGLAEPEVRRIEESDLSGLVRCMYRCYGYTYPDPGFYEERHIRRLLRSGRLVSVVAVDSEGEVVGHCALSFDGEDCVVPEAGRMVVDPRYRGHHLAERMAELRNEIAIEMGLPGVFCDCVTNHVGSQRAALQRGSVEVGLLVGAVGASVSMAALPNAGEGRRSQLALYNTCVPRLSGRISLVDGHAGLVGPMVEALGLDREISTTEELPAELQSSLRISVATWADGIAELRVARIGSDLIERVVDEIEDLFGLDLATTMIDLPAHDPSAAWAAARLGRLGFIFCSYLPEFFGHSDCIRLQRVHDRPIAFDAINCARPEGEQLRDAVLADWRSAL